MVKMIVAVLNTKGGVGKTTISLNLAAARALEGRDVLAVERGLEKFVAPEFRLNAHHWLILHGRYVCVARTPKCPQCAISDLCEFRDKTLS